MDGWMDGRTDGRTDGRMYGWMDACMHAWIAWIHFTIQCNTNPNTTQPTFDIAFFLNLRSARTRLGLAVAAVLQSNCVQRRGSIPYSSGYRSNALTDMPLCCTISLIQ